MNRPATCGEDSAADPGSWATALLAESRLPVALLDADGLLLAASPAMLAGLGRGPDHPHDPTGPPFDPIDHPHDPTGPSSDPIGRPLTASGRWAGTPQARLRLREAIIAAVEGDTVRYRDEVGAPHGFDLVLRPPRRATPPAVRVVVEGGCTDPVEASAAEQLRLALDSAGMGMITWDVTTDLISWIGRSGDEFSPAVITAHARDAISHRVHPQDQPRLRAALDDALAGRAPLDLEIRSVTQPGAPPRWVLLRGRVYRDGGDRPVRVSGITLDVTERTQTRAEHARLLEGERRAAGRAAALQRITAALSEAATCEQVAAVMAEESLRTLGVAAARVELIAPEPIGDRRRPRDGLIVRSAGQAHLLRDLPPADSNETTVSVGHGGTRMVLNLACRGRRRGRWMIGWRTDPDRDDARPDGPRPDAVPADAVLGAPAVGCHGAAPTGWSGQDGLDLLRTLATECAQALDRAELYEQQRDIATVLQRTLLPEGLPEVAGARVAARYQPGGQGVDVGGDWYDVIALPDGRTGLVIGDVEGHSAVAAAVMGQVRNALRAYAVEGCTPSIVMERLNRLLIRLRITQLVTCCYLEFAPSEGTATVVLAGHPPPLLLRPDGRAQYVPARPNLVLGVDETTAYTETTVLLDPGAHLLLYTDGLVETVDRSLPRGLEALRGWTEDWDPEAPPDRLVETLIRRAREGRRVLDDVAVLALRYLPTRWPAGGPRAVRRTFPLDPTSASAARRFVSDVLTQWGQDDLVHQVTLMASELVTNSVLHTSGELQLGLRLDTERLRVEVIDRSERLPTLQHPDADAPGGRGLLIISALAHTWGVDGRGDGKAVWFEVLLNPARPPD